MVKKDNISYREVLLLHKRGLMIFWRICPGIFLSRACYALMTGITPYVTIYLSARLVGELAGERDIRQIVIWVAAVLAAGLLLGIGSGCIKRWKLYENASIWQDKDRVLIDKLLNMDFSVMDDPATHHLLAQIQQNSIWGGVGIYKIPELFEKSISSMISILCAISLTIGLFAEKVPKTAGMLCILNHPLWIGVLSVLLLGTAMLVIIIYKRINIYFEECTKETELGNRVWGFFMFEMTDMERAMDMRIYNQQDIGIHYFQNHNNYVMALKRLAKGKMGLMKGLAAAVAVSFQGVIDLFVCMKAWAGAFDIGMATQYIGAVTALYSGVETLVQTYGILQNNAPFLRTLFEFLDIPNLMYQGSLTVEKRQDQRYEIEFKDVSFKYPSSKQWALRHISMRFHIGERLAIVGENGSGKTTFIKLLCRLYDPTEGVILLNGIDIRKYNYREYMSVFAVVFQDFQLLSCSLGENMAAGKSYEKEKVEQCLIKADFGDRLQKLPKGLETCLYKHFDKEGIELSGGEAQKIALARALYKDAPFAILDEPTAALDPEAEQKVYEKFNEIAGDKTAIYISHRLSSCRLCDVVAVFDRGRIIQYGSHEQLLEETEGKYYQLWYAQAQYYIEEQERQKMWNNLIADET